MSTRGAFAIGGVAIGIAIALSFVTPPTARVASASAPSGCPTVDTPPRYPTIAATFEQRCARCHDATKSANRGPQRVFEMSKGYPFGTARPRTLLADLCRMFVHRDGLTADERCRGLSWLDGGGLDAAGHAPRWRAVP